MRSVDCDRKARVGCWVSGCTTYAPLTKKYWICKIWGDKVLRSMKDAKRQQQCSAQQRDGSRPRHE